MTVGEEEEEEEGVAEEELEARWYGGEYAGQRSWRRSRMTTKRRRKKRRRGERTSYPEGGVSTSWETRGERLLKGRRKGSFGKEARIPGRCPSAGCWTDWSSRSREK